MDQVSTSHNFFEEFRQDLTKLLLICIWPQQTWTFYMAFRDFGWVAERSNYGDAIGLLSYAAIFALAEGLLMFFVILVVKPFLPNRWTSKKKVSMLSWILVILTFWAIVPQLYGLSGNHIPGFLMKLSVLSGHPLRILYVSALSATLLSIGLPLILILKKPKVADAISSILDRIALLSIFYLVIDLFALINIIVRNI